MLSLEVINKLKEKKRKFGIQERYERKPYLLGWRISFGSPVALVLSLPLDASLLFDRKQLLSVTGPGSPVKSPLVPVPVTIVELE